MSIINSLPVYIDETNDQLIRKTVLEGKSISKFTLQTGVKNESAIMLLDTSVVLQDGSNCDFTDLGSSTITERTIKAPFVKVNTTFCEDKLNNSALQFKVNNDVNDESLAYEADFVGGINDELTVLKENLVWQGDTALTGSTTLKWTDGLIKIIKADVPVGNVVGNTSGLTSSNIIDQVDAIYVAIPSALLGKAEIFMGTDSFRKYTLALQKLNLYMPAPASDKFEAFYPNSSVKINAVPGLDGTDFIVALDPKKVFYGTDLTNGTERYKMTYHLSKLYLEIKFNMGFQIARPNEVIYRYKA